MKGLRLPDPLKIADSLTPERIDRKIADAE